MTQPNDEWQRVEPRVSRLHMHSDYLRHTVYEYLSRDDAPSDWDLDELEGYAARRVNELMPPGYSFEPTTLALNLPAPTGGEVWVPLALYAYESHQHEEMAVFDQAFHAALEEATTKADNGEAPQFLLNPARKEN